MTTTTMIALVNVRSKAGGKPSTARPSNKNKEELKLNFVLLGCPRKKLN